MMSDPVSNAEIEDVLSSIRRLVSVDDRADASADDQRDTSLKQASEPSPEGADTRLVLTPALRVDASATADTTDPDPRPESPAEGVTSAQGDADQTPSAETSAPSALRFSHRAHEDDPRDTADEPADPEGPDAGGKTTSDKATHQGDVPYVLDPSLTAAPSHAQGLGDRIAEVEAAVAAQDDQWEPDGESDDAYSGAAISPMAWEDYGPEPDYDDAEDMDDPDDMGAADSDVSLTDPAAAGDKEHTAAPMSQASGMADEHHTDPSHETMGSSGPEDWHESEGGEDATLWEDDRADTVIDEDALRDMVSEIVRQELQGALGERITRNVRKLVRREIHRALSSHELD